MDSQEEFTYEIDEEYEKRRALRQQKWEATKRRQQRLQKLFIGGIGCLIALIGIIIFVVLRSGEGRKAADEDKILEERQAVELDISGEQDKSEKQNQSVDYTYLPMDDWRFVGLTIPKWEYIPNITYATELKAPQEYVSVETPQTAYMGSEEVISQYGLLVNVSKHEVVASKNGFDVMYPASMTKIMTLLTASDYITNLEDEVTITDEVLTYVWKNDCSAAGFSSGEVVTVKDLLYGTILPSGGDAAYALAVYVAGSHEAFAELMNEKAAQLGLQNTTHFTNAVGIFNANHYTTCADLAIILEAAMDNPLCREVLSEHIYVTSATEQHPERIELSNWFLRRIEDKDCGGLVVGAKTGFVNESGCCGASYFEASDGDAFICVTGNAHSSWRCIYDHVAVYNIYAVGNTGYHKK